MKYYLTSSPAAKVRYPSHVEPPNGVGGKLKPLKSAKKEKSEEDEVPPFFYYIRLTLRAKGR